MSLEFKFNMLAEGYTLVETFPKMNKHKKQVNIWVKGSDKIAEMYLTKGQTTLVDYDKLEEVAQFNWYASKKRSLGYAVATNVKVDGKGSFMLLHQLLTGVGFGKGKGCSEVCNHLNRAYPDSYELDNRMNNLEVTSNNVNMRDRRMQKNNSTGEDSITWDERAKFYRVQVAVGGKRLYTPSFPINLYGSKEAAMSEAIIIRDCFKCILHDNVNGNAGISTQRITDALRTKYKQGTFKPKTRRGEILLEMFKRFDVYIDTI